MNTTDPIIDTDPASQTGTPFISIITPAYKGTEHLPRLLENLEEIYKTNKDIEWIIIDDASPDSGATRLCIETILIRNSIPTRAVFLTENHYGSKSTWAGATIASGEYIIILDQDDTLTIDAIQVYKKLIRQFGSNKKIAGACGRCINSSNNFIGTHHKSEPTITNDPHYRHKLKIHGELLQCTRKDLILEYCKEMRPGNTNGLMWARISDSFDFVYTNIATRNYNTSNPSSVSNIKKTRFVSTVASEYREHLERIFKYIAADPIQILRHAIHTRRFEYIAKIIDNRPIVQTKLSLAILLIVLAPISYALARRDIKTNRAFRN